MTVELPAIYPENLLRAWRETLPELLTPGDGCEVHLENLPYSLFIHIDVSGHGMYSFDFRANIWMIEKSKLNCCMCRGEASISMNGRMRCSNCSRLYPPYPECAQQLHSVTPYL